MKRTYWYLAITGISGALITVAIADNVLKPSKSSPSASQERSPFFSRSSGHKGVSGSAADTGDENDPLRIVPTSSDANEDAQFDGLLKNADSIQLRSVPASDFEPAGYDDEHAAHGSDTQGSAEIVPAGGLFGRRSNSSVARPSTSSKSLPSKEEAKTKPPGPEGTDVINTANVLPIDSALDGGVDELDSPSPFDVLDEDFAKEAPAAPAAPENRDPNFRLEDDRELIEIELGHQRRSVEAKSADNPRNNDLQNLFDPQNGDSQKTGLSSEPTKLPPANLANDPAVNPAERNSPPALPVSTSTGSKFSRSATISGGSPANAAITTPALSASNDVTPSVSLTWVNRGTVNIGQPSECELVVRNTGNTRVENVNVDVYVPLTVRLTKAEPVAREEVDHLTWVIPTLETQKEYKILIELIPHERGPLSLSAQVRFTGTSKSSLTVEEPMLKLALKGPTDISLGDPASQVVVVSNPGTGVAQNVVLECTLSEGLTNKKGREFRLEVGSLEGGETRQFRLPIEATAGGTQSVTIVAQALGGLSHTSESTIEVSAPSLEAVVKGPGFRYLQRTAPYAVTISNSGQAESNNIRVIYNIPPGFEFIAAGQGGRFNSQENTVLWFVGQLGSKQSRELTIDLNPVETGEFKHEVTVVSDGGTTISASTDTEVDGVVDLVLQVAEEDDPVEIGTDAAYEIKVRNDGTKTATNVVLSCTIPAGVELQSASGSGNATSTLGDVTFAAIPSLKPGETASYRVIVQGKTAGLHRLRTELTSDSLSEPIVDEELTRFYGE